MPQWAKTLRSERVNETIGVRDAFNWPPGGADTMWSAKVGTFPVDRRSRGGLPQRNLHTAVAQTRHYRFQRPPKGFGVFRLCWLLLGVFWFSVPADRAVPRRCGVSQVSGSSRQDLPAVSCLIGTPPVCFFCFPSAVALIVWLNGLLSHCGVELAASCLSPCSVSAATSCFKCVRAKRVSAPLKPHRCFQTDAITLERRWDSTLEAVLLPSWTVGIIQLNFGGGRTDGCGNSTSQWCTTGGLGIIIWKYDWEKRKMINKYH